MVRATFTLLTLLGLSYASVASADNWNEGIDGDLSNNRLVPTVISLDPGSNTITATSVAGDPEYYAVNVPPGYQLSALTLVSYVSLDSVAFVGVQNGTTFTEPATGTDVSQLLGWLHFGPSLVGTDILDDIGTGAGAIGFAGPQPAGDYTFWSQQTGANAATYTFDLQVAPAGVSDQPIGAIKLIIKIAASGKEKLVFVSKDPAFLFPPLGSDDDPANGSPGGAIIDLLTRDGGNATFTVPPGESPAPGWKVKDGVVDLYKYINKDAPGGPVPIKVVVLKDTKVLKVVGKETGVPLAGTLGDVVVRITTGTTRNCARFDAATILKDEPGKFIAKGAVAASLADCASGPPTTSTSTTTSSSTSTSTSSTTSTSSSTSSTTSTTLGSPSGAFVG